MVASTEPAALAAGKAFTELVPGAEVMHTTALNASPLNEGAVAYGARVGGRESYCDMVRRLHDCVLEVEETVGPVVVFGSAKACRLLRCYFMGLPVAENMHASSSDAAAALHPGSSRRVDLKPTAVGWAEGVADLDAPPADPLQP